MSRHCTRLILILTLLGALSGCTHVKPYERETLAHMQEQLDRASASAEFKAHMWLVREGSIGGTGKPGGGCGCN